MTRRLILLILRVFGVGLIASGWLLSFAVQPAAASVSYSEVQATDSSEKYCQISFEGVHAANLLDQGGALVATYPGFQDSMQPGSGNGSSGSVGAFTIPYGTTTDRLIIQQNAISSFTIRITYYESSMTTGRPVPRYMVIFSDVSVAASGSAMMDVICSYEMGGMKLHVDQTGDSFVDETLLPSGVITEKQIQDAVAPVTVIKMQANPFGLFLTDMVEVSLEPRDTGSGILKTEYSLDAGSTWIVYQEPFRVSVADTSLVFARSFDMVGNQEFPWVYRKVTASSDIPVMIWVMVGVDVLLVVIAVVSLSYLKSVLKERKAAKQMSITRSA